MPVSMRCRANITGREMTEMSERKENRESRENKENKERKESKERRESEESRESKEHRESKEARENEEIRENEESRGNEENQENKISRESRKKLLPWREAIRLNNRAFRLFYRRDPQQVLSRLISVVWTALTPYVGIYLSALIIGELAGGRDRERLEYLVLLTLGAAAVIALVSAFLDKWTEVRSAGLWIKTEHIWAEKLLDMDYGNLDKAENAELLSKVRENHNYGGRGLYRVLGNYEALCSAVLTILGGVSLTVSLFLSRVPESAGACAILNNSLFLVPVAVVMLATTYAAPALSNKAGSYWARNVDHQVLANRMYVFFCWLGNQKAMAADMRMYRQDKICEKYAHDKESIFGSKGMFAKYSRGPIGLYSAASSAVSVIFTGIVYVFVCLKAWAGAFGLGAVTQYAASVTKMSGGVSALIAALGDMRNNASFLAQAFSFLDIPNQMYQGSLTVEKRRDRKYEVEFCNVSFRYPGSSNYALRHVNMKFEIGSRLAVVGRNGSGKTTFIKLLCRLYDPTEGEIRLNGIDIRKYDYEEYKQIFSVVFQDFSLFALKLGENVASGTEYDSRRAREALEKAGFEDKLAEWPAGLETYLYKDYDKSGVNVSGGEAQKIAMARALYKDAPFIILDEPTAALDPLAEAEVYAKFNEIVGDRTAVYISHRLSSCRFCDEIAVFHEGTVVQQGTHDALVAERTGKYYDLWHAQAQYYTE